MAVTTNGLWKLCPRFVHSFHGFAEVIKQFREVFTNSVTLGEKLEESCAGRRHWTSCCATWGAYSSGHNGIGHPEKGWRQTGRRSNWRAEESHSAGTGKGPFFIWGGLLVWCTRPKCRMVQRASSSCSACGPVLLCHLRRGKELSPRHRRIFFSRVLIELSPARNRTCAISVRCERNCSSPSAPPAPPPLLPPSGTLPACSLRASPWMPAAVYIITHFKVLYY